MISVCDIEGKRQECATEADIRVAFSKPGHVTTFFAVGKEHPITDIGAALAAGEEAIYAVYESEHSVWVRESFPDHIASIFGGTVALQTYSRLPWQSRFLGGTEYIDGIHIDDFGKDPNECVVLGSDEFGRAFVAFHATRESGSGSCSDTTTVAGVIFQRYSNCKRKWAFAGRVPLCGALTKDTNHDHEILRQMLTPEGWRNQQEETWRIRLPSS